MAILRNHLSKNFLNQEGFKGALQAYIYIGVYIILDIVQIEQIFMMKDVFNYTVLKWKKMASIARQKNSIITPTMR